MKKLEELQVSALDYYNANGRHTLPWRKDTSPYSIFISEVMLQQTQVSRVLTKYTEFMATLPSFEALASAPQAEVLKLWQGLGYNRRALWLKQASEMVVHEYGGVLPKDPVELQRLPGIGPNTAGSIAAFAYNSPAVFVETNIRRVFIHHCFASRDSVSDAEILPLIQQSLDQLDDSPGPRVWYWALMDYGSFLAGQVPNPNQRSKHYAKQSKFAGSDRQIRGEILRLLLPGGMSTPQLIRALEPYSQDHHRVTRIIQALMQEGFVMFQKDHYKLA